MKRLCSPLRMFVGIACAGMIATPAMSSIVSAAPTIVRSANARTQVPDTPPPPPVPDPLNGPRPSSPQPLAGAGDSALPPPPAPTPDAGGPPYTGPFGATRETQPQPQQFPGDPGGFGSHLRPTPVDGIPFDPSHSQPVLNPNPQVPVGAVTDRFGVAPPPGTLGHTYQRRSRLVDDDKHPRLGVVEVNLSENYDVSAKGLKSKWTGKVWRLESDPLLPGIPHIFEVKAEWGPEGAKQSEIRTVRLIMGRIVDLDF